MSITFMKNLMMYQHNTSPYVMFEDVYGTGCHESYRDEKVGMMHLDWLRWAGSLDDEHLFRLVNVIENYGRFCGV